ncbi:MAG: hypothetical protein A2075_20955 [Geobacteraceae bacterium GWC2_58_44]|nr:MAG: hypothetical protein A2075_20955 [Geobacteraceae bacterium GWC2_58_44]HBG05250.1 hypothetical protein [Geobacter sp.]
MEHSQIVTAKELENYSETRDSEAIIPELVWMLVNESVSDLTTCRIPYGDAINQPGWDGLVETENGYRQFVPKKKSYWEIGTGNNPQDKATKDFKKRTDEMILEERQVASYVFVTPRGAGSGGWNDPAQKKWVKARMKFCWQNVKILDAIQLADWVREFPAIGKWLLKRMGLVKKAAGFTTPTEHWENLQALTQHGDPPLPPDIFLIGRDKACAEVQRLFRGEIGQLAFSAESEQDVEDFIAAFLASLEDGTRHSFSNRCIFIKDDEAWLSMVTLKTSHVLVAHPKLDLESSGEQLHMAAKKNGHAVIIPISGAWSSGSESLIPLRSPSASILENTLIGCGYSNERARELSGAGALSLSALKRHLRGFGELPPYATWENARVLAQAGLFGRWNGANQSDKAAVETGVGKPYGEWIESVRPETLRSDTPLTQRDENWKMNFRAEAWSALGPRLYDEDLERFKTVAVAVLGERDPQFDLPREKRYEASIHGKVLEHSSSIRKGLAESLALLGSKPSALSSCTQGKAELVATLTVRELLTDADWVTWASLDSLLPLLAEASPNEFLAAVETALLNPPKSPFHALFAQEGSGITGRNHTSGLLWALETLAWHPDYLLRVSILLAEMASIDPGGQYSNRPANSLADIFLPWHPQTCATVQKKTLTVGAVLREQPMVGWKLVLALLPNFHQATSGTRKPAWRDFISGTWSEGVTNHEYWEQVAGYADLAVQTAAVDLTKLAELINRLPDLPEPAYSRVLEHLSTANVLELPEPERLSLWEALVDLAAKHRKFNNAQWAMPLEAVAKIEDVAVMLSPKSPTLLYRRLFSNRESNLYEQVGDYEENQRQLNMRRQAAVQEILLENGIIGVLDFALQVASPEKVGNALGSLESDDSDSVLLPAYLKAEKAISAFLRGFVWGRFWSRSWLWVDGVVTGAWSVEEKAIFYSSLPFERNTWQRAEISLGDDAAEYWKIVNANPWGEKVNLIEAVEKLLCNNRPHEALRCLYRLITDKAKLETNLVIRALMDCLKISDTSSDIDQYELIEIIKWLQENPDSDPNALFQIEWAYLPVLDRINEAAPKTIELRLASDPGFFWEIIRMVFRSDKDDSIEQRPTVVDKKIVQNAFRLLHGWQRVPGSATGNFDSTAFQTWLAEVKRLSIHSGHLGISMDQVGKVLAYAPADPSGLWIDKTVAEALNSKDSTEMRAGFTCQLSNMRGVFTFTSGRDERKIAARYQDQAEELEKYGYHRFATAMRGLAKSYEQQADRESNRKPFDD